MSVINNNLLLTPEGYQISRSVRLRSSASAYFNRTPASAGNRKTWTWSGWVKRGALGIANTFFSAGRNVVGEQQTTISFNSSNQISIYSGVTGVTNQILMTTSAVYRDASAWYHVAIVMDTPQALLDNRLKVYVNASQATLVSGGWTPAQNFDAAQNNTVEHDIGTTPSGGSVYFDGYLTEVNFIDGQALTPSSFGETDAVTGVWKPKKYAGTYGTNGFYLNFSDPSAATAAAIGKDNSGNGNNWTPNNISVTAGATYDSMLDVPTMWADGGNGRGNYCVLNPVWKSSSASTSNANLTLSQTAALDVNQTTMGVSSGKWYWEATVTSVGATPVPMLGVVKGGGLDAYTSANAYYYYGNSGQKFIGSSASAYGATYTTNDVVGVALDMDAGTLTFYKNNTSQGTATTGLSGDFFPAFSNGGGPTPSWSAALNFGQRPFAYTPPTGFKALNTQNLPDAAIKKGNAYFDATTYTGTGGTQTVSNLSFQPDLVWIKNRSAVANHALLDSVRPSGYALYPNLTDAEANNSTLFTGISGNSFSLAGSNATYNAANNYISWLWKESASAGFDIVTYTGNGDTSGTRAIAHNLGVAPKVVLGKARSITSSWVWWTTVLGGMNYLTLDTTGAAAAAGELAPTSSNFYVGGNNANGATYVAYLFAEVAGFSKMGSYAGNSSTDGPFIYTGFKPKFVLIKKTNAAGTWWMVDTARDSYNLSNHNLRANGADVEGVGTFADIDILSNGFKLRTTNGETNISGSTYIYMAFAESPFKNSLAR